MNRKNIIVRILLFGLLLFTFSCQNGLPRPIPEKDPDLSQGKYEKHVSLLKDAYSTNNNFDAALQIANLKGDKSSAYQLLRSSIDENPSRCEKIYEWYWLYNRHNFGVSILKYDISEYKMVLTQCDKLKHPNSYQVYAKMKDEEEKHAIENRPKEDSTNFNMTLVRELKVIHDDDQEIRKRYTAKNVSPELKKELAKEMQYIDSINLIKIDKIFKEFGYPSRELVGKDGNFTPALVIHHSNSLESRYKYLPLLEKAVEDGLLYEGTLDLIKKRIEDMKLDQKLVDNTS